MGKTLVELRLPEVSKPPQHFHLKATWERFRKILLTVAFLVQSFPLTQQALAQENVREQCRRAVHGVLLTWHDAQRLARIQEQSFADKATRVRLQLEQKRIFLQGLVTEAESREFDAALLRERRVVVAEIAALEQELQLLLEQTDLVAQNARSALKRYERLLAAAKTVFMIEQGSKEGSMAPNPYDLKVEYLQPCPKYQFVCKLKAAHQQRLAEILAIDETALHRCQMYLDQSQ